MFYYYHSTLASGFVVGESDSMIGSTNFDVAIWIYSLMLLLWDLPCFFVLNPFSSSNLCFNPAMLSDRTALKAVFLKLHEWIPLRILFRTRFSKSGLQPRNLHCKQTLKWCHGLRTTLWVESSGIPQVRVCKCSSNLCDLSHGFESQFPHFTNRNWNNNIGLGDCCWIKRASECDSP